jgi:alpha-beta hydrolase superfamily lysophospholipase
MLKSCLVFLATACGAADPGVRMEPKVTAAADLDWADTTFDGHGVKLYAQRWRPKGEIKAVVAIHHGLADHGGRYAAFAERLAHAGYAVWALDMRGHAHSAGARVTASSIDEFLDDLDAFLHLVREREPGKPVYLFGHSLGGLISALYTIERQPDLAGVILSGPGIAFDAPPIQAGAIGVLAAIAPAAPLLATPHADFSASGDVIADMNKDPLIFQGSGAARTARAAIDGVRRVWAAPEKLTRPLLVVAGSGDKICAPSGGRDLVARAGAGDHTFRLYDGLNHDLMHEPNGGGERVMADIQTWLDAHVDGKALPPPALPTEKLRGDRPAVAMSVELDGRGETPRQGSGLGITGGLRFRMGIGREVGYLGGLDVRAGAYPDGRGALYLADLHALGIAARSSSGAMLGVTAGVGIGGVRGASATHVPVELAAEAPVGPVRALARFGLGWRLSGDRYASDAHGIADEMTALVGVRLGRDRRYWAHVVAGGGPYLAVTYQDLGGGELVGLALGIDMWGAN